MIDQAAAERLQIFAVTRTTWNIVSGTGTYTVGVGGTVNVARPVFLDHVSYQDTSTTPDTEYPLTPLTEDAWAGVVMKDEDGEIPSRYYYSPTYPLGTLRLWPIPTGTTLQGVLYAPAASPVFAALTTAVSLPPGYEEWLVTNLAINLATSYGRQPDQLLFKRAVAAKEVVKRANLRLQDMSFEAGALIGSAGGAWSIYEGP